MSTRMSSYQYTKKSTTWKWTPGKIAGLSMFGMVMATLVYLESTSGRSTYEAPSLTIQETLEPESNFDQAYEDFLKQGVKVLPKETVDSLRDTVLETDGQNSSDENNVDESLEDRVISQPSKAQISKEKVRSSTPSLSTDLAKEPAQDKVVENNLGTIDLSPPPAKKTPQDKSSSLSLGTLEETSPPDDSRFRRGQSEDTDKTITEEFYTEEVITGRTMAASDGTPLAGVQIKVKGTDRTTVSNTNGHYSIKVPGDPNHRIVQYSYQGNVTEREVAPGTEMVNIRF